jgi:hypothetical protein
MSTELECSIDYLINESMRYYARSKNYPSAGAPAGAQQGVPPGPPQHAGMGGAPPGPALGGEQGVERAFPAVGQRETPDLVEAPPADLGSLQTAGEHLRCTGGGQRAPELVRADEGDGQVPESGSVRRPTTSTAPSPPSGGVTGDTAAGCGVGVAPVAESLDEGDHLGDPGPSRRPGPDPMASGKRH